MFRAAKSKKLNAGVGAECSVLIKFLHPSKRVKEVLINKTAKDRLENLVAVKSETRSVYWKQQSCIVYRHDLFPNEYLHSYERYCKVIKKGKPIDFFIDLDEIEVQVQAEVAGGS